jgi:excisionase family DNA binding protein
MTVIDGWLTTDEAAEMTGYSTVYIRQLARRGSIEARKAGRDWLIGEDSIRRYKEQMDDLGRSKHDPWRDDLTHQGRGRAEDKD